MNYADFQTYMLRRHWRTGDTALTTDLPELIATAEKRIARDLRENSVSVEQTGSLTGLSLTLPTGFKELISFKLDSITDYAVVYTRSNYERLLHRYNAGDTSHRGTAACIQGNTLYVLNNGTVAEPENYTMFYYGELTPYSTDPASPFRDDHPDFYQAAVDIHILDYLKSFEEKANKEKEYLGLLEDMITASNYRALPSGQMGSANIPDGVL